MLTHITLTVHVSLAHVWYNVHANYQSDDGSEPVALQRAGFIPLEYGEADDVTVSALLASVRDALQYPSSDRGND